MRWQEMKLDMAKVLKAYSRDILTDKIRHNDGHIINTNGSQINPTAVFGT